MLRSISAEVKCPHCDRSHTVDRDEAGAPDLDLVPCQGSDSCLEKLCADCRVGCDLCGLWACEDHIRTVPVNTRICDICFDDEVDPITD
jgi:hypothetical protein